MRDIPKLLELWGSWALNDCSGTDYSHIAAGFRNLLPPSGRSRPACGDDDGLIIESCLVQLKKKRPSEHSLLVAHYMYGLPKRKIAKVMNKDEKLVRIQIQMAEGFVEGCLSMMNVRLECEG
ncbi:antitermination protein Q [Enterobacteriaceae bacterium]